MASIERTAYLRFKKMLTRAELNQHYQPSDKELAFVRRYAKGNQQQLTLMALLKSQQNLGYAPSTHTIPDDIIQALTVWLALPKHTSLIKPTDANKKSFYRYRQSIRHFLGVRAWSADAKVLVKQAIEKAAYTMSDPADLINVAIEKLLHHHYELPAFSTLDRLTGYMRQQVHEQLYQQIDGNLSDVQRHTLSQLLDVRDNERLSDVSRIKQVPGKATLKNMNEWARRLDWLTAIIDPQPIINPLSYTKIRQFAAEAAALEIGDLKDIHHTPRQYTLLLCLINQAQVQTRNELVIMFLKRMKRTHKQAQETLKLLQERARALEEKMMAAFSQVISKATEEPSHAEFGRQVRDILDHYGGAETLMAHYQQVSAYHDNNFLPLLWDIHRTHRAALFRLLSLLNIQATTQDTGLLQALHFIQKHQHTRRKTLCADISIDFASHRWKELVYCQQQGKRTLKRRELEVCILSYIADGLRCGDLYVEGSDEFSDYRQQLLPWCECAHRVPNYCNDVRLPSSAGSLVNHLKQQLVSAAEAADKAYPTNAAFTLDEKGTPHLKRIKADPPPEGLAGFKNAVRQRLPERHLLDVLKNVQHWVDYTRHFTPPSHTDPKISDAVSRYLFTIFCYGCNLGAAQTARHAQDDITLRILKRINDQHITTSKLEAALTDVINTYARFDLPFLWGKGRAAIADGTHIELVENNLLGEQHIRYGAYGGIAYHHISDTYIALFSHFIACGVWEAVYILDGLLKNTSQLQPDTLHADTQGQSEPVFGLAYLLGIKLMPRMRTWDDVTFYRPDARTTYKHIDSLFTQTVDWALIETHWQDLMQVVLSIQAGKVLPSMLLQKLGVYSKKNKLYQAFRELGRVMRTIFLLEYCTSQAMRKEIGAATTKVESFNAFCDWIAFGGHVVTSADPVEQEKRIKYRSLVANIVMLQNVADLTKVLNHMVAEGQHVTLTLAQTLSPYMTENNKRFGQFILDMKAAAEPFGAPELTLT
jgi:TnpA family transposase